MGSGYPFGEIMAEIGQRIEIKGIFGGGWQ